MQTVAISRRCFAKNGEEMNKELQRMLSFKLAVASQPRKHIVSTLFFLLIQILHVGRAISRIADY